MVSCGKGTPLQFTHLLILARPVKADATLSNAKPSDLWTFGGEAHATASYGILGASAKDSSTCTMFNSILCGGAAGFSAMGFAFGTATFTDTLVYTPGPEMIVACNPPPGFACKVPTTGDSGSFLPSRSPVPLLGGMMHLHPPLRMFLTRVVSRTFHLGRHVSPAPTIRRSGFFVPQLRAMSFLAAHHPPQS